MSIQKTYLSTDKKDVKHNTVLPKSVPRSATAPVAQSGRKSNVDEKSLSTTSPASSPTILPDPSVLKSLKLDITNCKDEKTAAALERAAVYLLSKSNGIAGDLKRTYFSWVGASLSPSGMMNRLYTYSAGLYTPVCGFPVNAAIPSGNVINNRLGRLIRLKHLTVRMDLQWFLINNDTSRYSNGPSTLRCLVYRDKQPLAGIPKNWASTLTDTDAVLYDAALTGAEPSKFPYNPTTHGFRYEILYNQAVQAPAHTTALSPAAGGIFATATRFIEFHVPVDGITCEFADDSTTNVLITNEIDIMFTYDGADANWASNISVITECSFVDC